MRRDPGAGDCQTGRRLRMKLTMNRCWHLRASLRQILGQRAHDGVNIRFRLEADAGRVGQVIFEKSI
jgi:hypothetical protein